MYCLLCNVYILLEAVFVQTFRLSKFHVILTVLFLVMLTGCSASDVNTKSSQLDNFELETASLEDIKNKIVSANRIEKLLEAYPAVQTSLKSYYIPSDIKYPNPNKEQLECYEQICYFAKEDNEILVYSQNLDDGTMFVLSPQYYYVSGINYEENDNIRYKKYTPLTYERYQQMLEEYMTLISDWFGGDASYVQGIEKQADNYLIDLEEELYANNQYGSYYKKSFGIHDDSIKITHKARVDKKDFRLIEISTSFYTKDFSNTESNGEINYLSQIPNIEFAKEVTSPQNSREVNIVTLDKQMNQMDYKRHRIPADAQIDLEIPENYTAYEDEFGNIPYVSDYFDNEDKYSNIYLIQNK